VTDIKGNKNAFCYFSYVSYIFSYILDIASENIGKIGNTFRFPIFLYL
jgi:hypothetical protein